MSSTSRRRSTTSSTSRRRRSSTATSRCRSTASASPTPSTTPTAPTQKHVQFFDNNGSRGIYSDGWFAATKGPFIPWDTPGSAKRLADLGFGDRRVGTLRPPHRLLAGERPRRGEPGEARGDEEALPRGRRGERRTFRSAPATGCASTRRTGSRRPTTSGPSARTPAACRNSPRPASAGRARR